MVQIVRDPPERWFLFKSFRSKGSYIFGALEHPNASCGTCVEPVMSRARVIEAHGKEGGEVGAREGERRLRGRGRRVRR